VGVAIGDSTTNLAVLVAWRQVRYNLLDMTVDNRDYIFETFLECLQLFQICQNMLKITVGWRRDFYAQQLGKNGNKIRKMIETWPVITRWN
jgi:hypothetical protein